MHRDMSMKIMSKRIVITGITGFIGSHLAKALLASGAEVFALVRGQSLEKMKEWNYPNLHILESDLTNLVQLKQQIRNADVFFHLAWGGVNREEIDSVEVQQTNVDLSMNCVELAHSLGCQVFFDAGSRVEYGVVESGMMEESISCNPVNEYGKAKLRFFQQARKKLEQYTITYFHLRYFSVYGIGDHPWSIISTLVRDLPQGKEISLSACEHRWNFMEITDATNAVLGLLETAEGCTKQHYIVNIASDDTRKLKDFVNEIYKICENRGSLKFGAFVQAKEGALQICPDIKQLKILTNGTYTEQVRFADGIVKMLER